jgi:hypothetical protein
MRSTRGPIILQTQVVFRNFRWSLQHSTLFFDLIIGKKVMAQPGKGGVALDT